MHTSTAAFATTPPHAPLPAARRAGAGGARAVGERIARTLQLVQEQLTPQRRIVRTGETIYQGGQAFGCLYLLNAGYVKFVNLSPDGREQVVGLKFRGDWLGFDGIATGQYTCDAIAMDTGEVWMIRYEALVAAFASQPTLLTAVHEAMSREIAHDHDSLMSVCTLPADARVADFLHYWAESVGHRGMRTDCITLRMTRAEIGNYLGLTLESVSRSLSRLAQARLIGFTEKGRRNVRIPDVDALAVFVQSCVAPVPTLQ